MVWVMSGPPPNPLPPCPSTVLISISSVAQTMLVPALTVPKWMGMGAPKADDVTPVSPTRGPVKAWLGGLGVRRIEARLAARLMPIRIAAETGSPLPP